MSYYFGRPVEEILMENKNKKDTETSNYFSDFSDKIYEDQIKRIDELYDSFEDDIAYFMGDNSLSGYSQNSYNKETKNVIIRFC